MDSRLRGNDKKTNIGVHLRSSAVNEVEKTKPI
jgi:hypothetical protein